MGDVFSNPINLMFTFIFKYRSLWIQVLTYQKNRHDNLNVPTCTKNFKLISPYDAIKEIEIETCSL